MVLMNMVMDVSMRRIISSSNDIMRRETRDLIKDWNLRGLRLRKERMNFHHFRCIDRRLSTTTAIRCHLTSNSTRWRRWTRIGSKRRIHCNGEWMRRQGRIESRRRTRMDSMKSSPSSCRKMSFNQCRTYGRNPIPLTLVVRNPIPLTLVVRMTIPLTLVVRNPIPLTLVVRMMRSWCRHIHWRMMLQHQSLKILVSTANQNNHVS